MADKDKVVGKALYMEFRSGNSTYQMIVTPDAVTSEGRNVPSTLYRRQISNVRPRRAWRTYSLPKLPQDASGLFATVPLQDAKDQAVSRITFIDATVQRLKSQGYALYMKPIVIEVSQADLSDIRQSKTPYKILGRITRTRKILGFSDKLFA